MRRINIIYLILLPFLLSACYKPESKEEKEFVQVCQSKSNKSDKECGCIFNKLKNKYAQEQLLDLFENNDEDKFSGKVIKKFMDLRVCE